MVRSHALDGRAAAEIAELESHFQRFLAGEITNDELRPRRTLYGIYGQRHKDRYMVRVKVPQGLLDPEQLAVLGRIAGDYSRGFAYVTTRQDIQYHFVLLERVPEVLRLLASVGLTTREAGGNIVRNVTADEMAGVCPAELFDVTPYAHAVSRHFLRHPAAQALPRKVKIAFSGCSHDHALTPVHDIGLQAAVRDGRRGFRVLVGGGLGVVPRLADELEPFVPEETLVPMCEAIVRVFDRTGERRNRNKARLKFVLWRLDVDEFRRLVKAELAAMPPPGADVYARPDLSLSEEEPAFVEAGFSTAPLDGFDVWRQANVLPQKQDGFYAVQVSLPAGAMSGEQFFALADIARRFGGGRVRTTIQQNLLLRWVREAELPAVHAALAAAGLDRPWAETLLDPVACPGAETCMSAITNSKALARALIEAFSLDGYLADPLVRPIRIKVSGCPNSCGHHHVADIGLYGCAVHVDGRLLPAYQVLVGGGDGAGLAQPLMKVPSRRVPAFLSALLDYYRRVRVEGEPFRSFVRRLGTDNLRTALREHATMPTFVQDPPAYVDWEAEKLFSLDERGEGECAV